jgi:ferredoxin
MVKHIGICDRCGDECYDNHYYIISIGRVRVDDPVGFVERRVDLENLQLCKSCVDSIEEFITTYPVGDFHINDNPKVALEKEEK